MTEAIEFIQFSIKLLRSMMELCVYMFLKQQIVSIASSIDLMHNIQCERAHKNFKSETSHLTKV